MFVPDYDINSMYWRNLSLIEDFDGDTQSIKVTHNKPYPKTVHAESNVITYKAPRRSDRRVFYVDVERNFTPEETAKHLEDIKREILTRKIELNAEYGKTSGFKPDEMIMHSSLDKPVEELPPVKLRGTTTVDTACFYAPYIPLMLTDYKVTCDESNNSQKDIDNGMLNVDITVKPPPVPNRIINPGMDFWRMKEISDEDQIQLQLQYGINLEAELNEILNTPFNLVEELEELREDFGIEIEEPVEVLPTAFSKKRVIEDGEVSGTLQENAGRFTIFNRQDNGATNER